LIAVKSRELHIEGKRRRGRRKSSTASERITMGEKNNAVGEGFELLIGGVFRRISKVTIIEKKNLILEESRKREVLQRGRSS